MDWNWTVRARARTRATVEVEEVNQFGRKVGQSSVGERICGVSCLILLSKEIGQSI